MSKARSMTFWVAGIIICLLGIYLINDRLQEITDSPDKKRVKAANPVEVASVVRGPLSLSRTFSGTIDPHARVTLASKVSGRILSLTVDVSDPVFRGQIIAEMEDAEFEQEALEAEARLAVEQANHIEAQSRLEIARRALERSKTLFDRGVASESAYDTARAEFLTSQAAVKVTEATIQKEDALLRAAKIRLGYTRVRAEWREGDDRRIVAERYVDEGNTVPANTPLLSLVEIDPVKAVIQVTERDYPRIKLGQQAQLQADAFPGQVFRGTVSRISPVFSESSRQARMEVRVDNPDNLLKPGMFTRCTLELDRAEDTVSVPEIAITRRDNQPGVFQVAEGGITVRWVVVKRGFKSGDQVQLLEPDLSGMVVTLGQQFLEDGSEIRVVSGPPQDDGGATLQ
jgi:RND family efflux transporter MFP subunit